MGNLERWVVGVSREHLWVGSRGCDLSFGFGGFTFQTQKFYVPSVGGHFLDRTLYDFVCPDSGHLRYSIGYCLMTLATARPGQGPPVRLI